jgi:hypothetical protein
VGATASHSALTAPFPKKFFFKKKKKSQKEQIEKNKSNKIKK